MVDDVILRRPARFLPAPFRRLWRRVRSTAELPYCRSVRDAEVVLIEVHGAALLRCVPARADVFEIVALRLQAADLLTLSAKRFSDLRIEAECEALKRARSTQRDVTLDDIYSAVIVKIPELDHARAMAEEIAVERALCAVNPKFKRLYDSLLATKQRVAFFSQTYLPEPLVAELLRAGGYDGRHDLFVSNGAQPPGSNSLLCATLLRLGTEPAKTVYLGVERLAVEAAERAGVTAYLCTEPGTDRDTGELADKVLDGLARLACEPNESPTENAMLRDIGFRVMGPIFLGFSQWLVERVRSEPADLVFFCARDGYFTHKAFARFAEHVALPPTRYFEVSRRALVFPTITELNARALDFLCANNAPLVLSEFFSRIGIDVSKYGEQLVAAGLDADSRIYDQESRIRLRQLFVILSKEILQQARSERISLMAYLRQSGACDANHLVLVDMGWGGTLQQAVADAFASEAHEPHLRAYYLSTDQRIRTLGAAAGPALAWFANAGEPEWMHEDISPGYWLLEIAFSADHGTVLGYRRALDGTVFPIYHTHDPHAPNARAAREIHHAASELLDRWMLIFNGVGPPVSMRSAFARFQRFVKQPTQAEARFFGDMVHIGGLGTTTETLPIASPPTLRDVLRRPRAALQSYRESLWQVAFLQRLTRSNVVARGLIAFRDMLRRARKQLKRGLHDTAERAQ